MKKWAKSMKFVLGVLVLTGIFAVSANAKISG
jgi:hypothetical protein